jgi:hypothetical protein
MKILSALLFLGLAVHAPAFAGADPGAKPAYADTKDARLIPVLKDDVFVGLKVYAIRDGGRFDQPAGKFEPGDTIETVDGAAVTTEAGAKALYDKVIRGAADTVVTVRRKGEVVSLTSTAIKS